MAERPSLSTAEAAARLGVKPETVYAYVSRGLITRHLADDGRTSRLDASDVERMARRGRRTASRRSALDVVLTTAITRIDESTLRFRGHDPAELAQRYPFEAVARLLWLGRLDDGPMEVAPDVAHQAKRAVAALAPDTPLLDRFRVVATVVGAADPYRGDLRPEAVVAVGSRVLAALPAALPRLGPPAAPLELAGRRHPSSLAERLWPCLTTKRGRAGSVRALNTALVQLADHELAVSTLAVRLAASGRAHPAACVHTGLGAMDGALHGGSSRRVHDLFSRCRTPADAPRVIGDILREGERVPGLGHAIYRTEDPRVAPILDAVRTSAVDRRRLAVVDAVLAAAGEVLPLVRNVELATAALTWTSHMPRDAGELLFATARSAGWLAHALEEYGEHPMRLRGRALYVGPAAPL
jgi:citrate synthase